MTVEPNELGKSAEPSARNEFGAVQANNALESGRAAGSGSSSTSPFRLLLVIVPMLIIVVTGTNLLGLWTTPSQQAAREERLKQAERDQHEYTTGEPTEQRPVNPEATWPDVRKLLERLRPHGDEEVGNRPPVDTAPTSIDSAPGAGQVTAEGAPAGTEAGFDATVVVELLADANPGDGASVFRMCRVCHADTKDAPTKIGPNLWGVVGRPKASHPDCRYSEASGHDRRSYTTGWDTILQKDMHPAIAVANTRFGQLLHARVHARRMAFRNGMSPGFRCSRMTRPRALHSQPHHARLMPFPPGERRNADGRRLNQDATTATSAS